MAFVWWMVASAGTVVTLTGTLFAWLRSRRRAECALTEDDLRITVMKPMSGLDPRLEENLESFAQRLGDVLLVPLKELVLFAAWVQAVFTFHVKWRADGAIQLGPNSLVLSKAANPSKLSRHAQSLRKVLGLA